MKRMRRKICEEGDEAEHHLSASFSLIVAVLT